MDANPQEQPFESPQQGEEKKGRGCLFWGCLISLLLFVLAVVGVVGGGYWFFNSQVKAYTDEAPADIPVIEANEQEITELKARVDTMQESIEAGEPAGELVLTAEDINKLISANEDTRGKVYVTIEDDKLRGDVSIPTNEIAPVFGDRYFNASATFNVSYEGGVLVVTLVDAEVKGERLPQEFIDAIAKQNLAEELYSDSEKAEVIRKFESIEVRDGKVILRAKDPAAEAAAEPQQSPDGAPADPAAADAPAPGGAAGEAPEEAPEEAAVPAG